MSRTSEPGRTVSSRLLSLLFAFEPGASDLSLAELARRTGLPHATARRLALELVDAGALERRGDGRFAIGLRLWQLGFVAHHRASLRPAAKPFMEDLFTAIKQHVQLTVLEGDESVVMKRLSAPGAPALISQSGGSLPLHCTASGKVLLAHASSALVDRVLDGPLPRHTERTIVDPRTLRRQLAACRRSGIASVRGELTEGADSVATRIIDREGHVVAALSVIVADTQVSIRTVIPSLVTTGLGISRLLGWQPGVPIRDPEE